MLISANNPVFIWNVVYIQQFSIREDLTVTVPIYFFKELITIIKISIFALLHTFIIFRYHI
ncbi:hypothetical protein C435_18099 [Haloarcula marismortui ATCC 33799]|uniref:Uncharacterized protein n=1 Tax=Haloarcula marismortui ATCC 33799 TaxID=662475 RepID=M0JS59_9EURY|nr:hypothetical protein C435_18099 [Haloarcula californiae ATCC 33799]